MKKETLIATLGNHPFENYGIVNPPIYRASTVLFPTLDEFEAAVDTYAGMQNLGQQSYTYGRYGTPTTRALEEAIAGLEGADHTFVVSSGVAAFNLALLSFLSKGDHLLMTDSVYGPTRKFCDEELKRFGIETTYYDPAIGADIAKLIKPNTKVVYCESPGSLTLEVQDIPAIAKAAHAKGAVVIADNTWATPLHFKPFAHGVDVSVHSGTKYISGHSDLMMGVVSVTKEHYPAVRRVFRNTGACSGVDDCYLALRGLRTIDVRMKQHQQSALAVAQWLQKQPQVEKVLHPALPEHPGHALWKRDMTGSCGLFSFILKPYARKALAHMLDNMQLFHMGVSWGGYESLIIPFKPPRSATSWPYKEPAIRVHIGLENVDDLIADLVAGLKRLDEASRAAA